MNRPAEFRGIFTNDSTARAVYSEAAGITRLIPAAVAVPVDTHDVQTLVRWAASEKIALTPRGSGSSMAGGAVGEGVIVDLSRLNEIGEIDPGTRTVRVGPGAICGLLNEKASVLGLRFPVDPSSARFASLGGMASTNASGSHSLKFGSCRNWIESLDCVFADGTTGIVRRGSDVPPNVPAVGRFLHDLQRSMPTAAGLSDFVHEGVRKESSGYGVGAYARSGDLVDLLVGSEGTLAIFVGIVVRLEPLPIAVSSVLAEFDSIDEAVTASRKSVALGGAACELLDQTFLEFAGICDKGSCPQAMLLAEIEADSAAEAAVGAQNLAREFHAAGARAVKVGISPLEQREIWEVRHAASPILGKLDPRLRSMQIVEDGAVPPVRLGEYVRGMRAALERAAMRGVIFGHAGDANVHANPLVDTAEFDWKERTVRLLEDVISLTHALGGTLSGEHGDGRLRAPFMSRVWSSSAMTLFGEIKRCFDPEGILNPGVKLAMANQHIDPIKFDPALADLPREARIALDEISSDRLYDQFRLSRIGQAQ